MIGNIKQLAILATTTVFFACSGGSDNTSDTDTVESPGPVSEMDRSRYNLNAPDEAVHEMQDSTEIDTLID